MDISYYINNIKKNTCIYTQNNLDMPYDIFTHYWLSFICNKTLNDNFVADKYTLPEVALAYCVYEFQFNI